VGTFWKRNLRADQGSALGIHNQQKALHPFSSNGTGPRVNVWISEAACNALWHEGVGKNKVSTEYQWMFPAVYSETKVEKDSR